MKKLELERYEEKVFYTLLIDAIGLAHEATNHSHDYAQQMLSRACILTCAMLLECCANICVASQSPHAKGTPIQKFEAYSNQAHGKTLDHERAEVRAVEELRDIRNRYVHVRTQQHPVLMPVEDHLSWGEVHPHTTPVLRLSVTPTMWHSTDAVNALKGVEGFLRYYFVELLAQSPKQLFERLSTSLYAQGGRATGSIAESLLAHAIAVGVSALNVDFSFLGSQSDA